MKRPVRAVLAAALLAGAHLLLPGDGLAQMSRSQIEESLTCQCGCGHTVANCDHVQCSFCVPVKKDITAALEAGQSGEQIVARYAEEYGEKVLSSPVPEGFNLLAWIGPYLAVFVGGIGILLTVRRWSSDKAPEAPVRATVDDGDRRRIEAELERLDS